MRKRKKVIVKTDKPFAQKVKVALMMRELVDSILDYGVQQGMKAVRGNSLDTRVCIDCGTIYLTEKISKAKCPACNSKCSVEYQGGGELVINEVTNEVTELNNER
jgi:predicted Zn-ribbon and HTH transcriptional regulator